MCEEAWENSRIYLPPSDDVGLPIDCEIRKYCDRELPAPIAPRGEVAFYSVPRTFVCRKKGGAEHDQGSLAERISYERFRDVTLKKKSSGYDEDHKVGDEEPSLWTVCFQGVAYAGRSNKGDRGGRIMTREHDLVVFNAYEGRFFVSLIEVKSCCDDRTSRHHKFSDAISIKNNKRSGQHQLRDHAEILERSCHVPGITLHRFLFWPFLSEWTTDPSGRRTKRWMGDRDLRHVFANTLHDQASFDEWLRSTLLEERSMERDNFERLLKRFIVLSCGIFVDEIHEGMLALLSQEQLALMHLKPHKDGSPTIVHGAAGTGKTLLILHKLDFLRREGLLDERNRALYICYWPGIRADFRRKLRDLNLDAYVDTTRFYITRDDFLEENAKKYRHIYMDESEAICVAFSETIVHNTLRKIAACRLVDHDERFSRNEENEECYGDFWYLVDINQAIFIPKHSPEVLKRATVTLSKVMRCTATIYRVFSQFYMNPLPNSRTLKGYEGAYSLGVGHDVCGPPIYWADAELFGRGVVDGLVRVVVDLHSSKGVRPGDICALPFIVTEDYLPESLNRAIGELFVAGGYRPRCIQRVEQFLLGDDTCEFLVPWGLRVKGLEFKVVVMAIESEDFDADDPEDRRKIYVMASRCTCLLIIVCPRGVKDKIDPRDEMKPYSFGIEFD